MSSIQSAIEFACRAHFGQWGDGEAPLPYIAHPIEVLINLRNVGEVTDEEMLCAAALHDTVEAESATLDEIEGAFGPRVRSLVGELTRREPSAAETEGMSKREIWQLRADMLVEETAKMCPDAQQIKLADRLANVRDAFRTKSGYKLERYLGQTKKILDVVPRSVNKGLWDATADECRRK